MASCGDEWNGVTAVLMGAPWVGGTTPCSARPGGAATPGFSRPDLRYCELGGRRQRRGLARGPRGRVLELHPRVGHGPEAQRHDVARVAHAELPRRLRPLLGEHVERAQHVPGLEVEQ